ncbi:MAG: site-specific DNA-methyltransferase, partial [Bacillota bacterium]
MPRLTEQEQQEIIRFIEADKPLPDKYRFLLFGDKREVELVWNGKSNDICNIVLPFQVIEQVDEPRSEKETKLIEQTSMFDTRGRQLQGWTNKLILSSLKNGPLRDEIEKQGGIKLIYIDPPFDVGADFSMDIEIGNDTFTKKPNILEEIAYRDTWGKGTDSFISMIYERLVLMRDLLTDDGGIFVHCDWRVSPLLRMVLGEIFGQNNFQNEIYWYYYNKLHGATKRVFPRATDTILYYLKNRDAGYTFNHLTEPREKPVKKLKYSFINGKIVNDKDENGKTITYLSTERQIDNVWRIRCLQPADKTEWLGYPTQKPQDLIERIILAASEPNDIVADFFCGSGSSLAAAESLGRKWIGSDLGKFAIHTTRK